MSKEYDCLHCREREREEQWDMENHRLARDDPEQFEIEYQKVRAAVLALEAKDG